MMCWSARQKAALHSARYCRRALAARRHQWRSRCRLLEGKALARVWDKRLAHELEYEKLMRDLREIDTAPKPHRTQRSTRKRKPLTPPKPPESKAEKEKRLEAEMEELRRKLDEL